MGIASSSSAEVRIKAIGAGGVGVGHLPDGRAVFVPRTAPGDRVRISLTQSKARFARGRIEALLESSPHRRDAPCRRYHECGGCALQHLTYGEQLYWKGRVVGDALRRIGGLEVPDPAVEPSPLELRYRNKVSFTLRRLSGDRVVAGFHQLETPGRVLDLGEECLLPLEGLGELWVRLRRGWGSKAARLPEGRELRLTLRAEADQGALVIRGGKGRGDPEALIREVPGLSSVWKETTGGHCRHLGGTETIRVSWLEERGELAGNAFLQVNSAAGEILHQFVLARARTANAPRVLEAYCGNGYLGRTLAREGMEVVGLELDPLSVSEARREAPATFRVVQGKVEEHLQEHLPADLVILNPPRKGLDKTVTEIMGRVPPRQIIYVSCDPATLARDIKRLGPAFELTELRSFDLFPQTGHVETVAVMERQPGSQRPFRP